MIVVPPFAAGPFNPLTPHSMNTEEMIDLLPMITGISFADRVELRKGLNKLLMLERVCQNLVDEIRAELSDGIDMVESDLTRNHIQRRLEQALT